MIFTKRSADTTLTKPTKNCLDRESYAATSDLMQESTRILFTIGGTSSSRDATN
ncbi:MAG: hypothetical protein LUH54_03090 [Firmicutes bacterium]|nr:hypothetical protein [Bacillota bacterium]